MGQWSQGYQYEIPFGRNGAVWRQSFSRLLEPAEHAYLVECVQGARWDEIRVLIALVEATA